MPTAPTCLPARPLSPQPVLESLDLRDNQLKALPRLAAFASLRYLEVSYNEVGGPEGRRPER